MRSVGAEDYFRLFGLAWGWREPRGRSTTGGSRLAEPLNRQCLAVKESSFFSFALALTFWPSEEVM